jgi:hypothetical protein
MGRGRRNHFDTRSRRSHTDVDADIELSLGLSGSDDQGRRQREGCSERSNVQTLHENLPVP